MPRSSSPTRRGRSAAQDVALADATAVELWNQEDSAEAETVGTGQLKVVVFSRDWTVETIVSQIQQGNIDLEPDFQRRNCMAGQSAPWSRRDGDLVLHEAHPRRRPSRSLGLLSLQPE
jgi:hypothetical protein